MKNLNAEAHFSQSPLDVEINRSVFDRSTNWKGTSIAGKLNCCFVDEILPGDTVDLRQTMLTRMLTPHFPVMDSCFLDQYYFFVPNRLVWSHWKEFFGENNESAWIQPIDYTVPQINASGDREIGDLAHQFGIPVYLQNKDGIANVNALPFRAYRLIWNEWFRDQNTQAPKLINLGDTETDTSLFELADVNRIHDYFGSCLPNSQKGAAVRIAISGSLPVVAKYNSVPGALAGHPMRMTQAGVDGRNPDTGSLKLGKNGSGQAVAFVDIDDGPIDLPGGLDGAYPNNLWADGSMSSVGIDVNALRLAVQTQRILEKLSIGGSRYVEFVRSMFGVVSPDARQQRPELIGYSRIRLNMQEVTQNSPAVPGETMTPLGTLGAYSKTIDNDMAFSYSATEHGYLFGLFCIRHNRSYSQGVSKMWYRKNRLDFYVPALAHIGEQPVYKKELYAGYNEGTPLDPDSIFGYQEAWAEYRYKPSINTGYMDPSVSPSDGGVGDVWTYGDVYQSEPYLSDTWMTEGSSEIDRTLAVQDNHQFMHDIWIDLKHSRVMPVYSVPGMVDHF